MSERKVLRTIYIDPEIDNAVIQRALLEGVTKGELIRRFIIDGLARSELAVIEDQRVSGSV